MGDGFSKGFTLQMSLILWSLDGPFLIPRSLVPLKTGTIGMLALSSSFPISVSSTVFVSFVSPLEISNVTSVLTPTVFFFSTDSFDDELSLPLLLDSGVEKLAF